MKSVTTKVTAIIALKKKPFNLYKFKDIPRRFLPCSYFELIIYQQQNIPPVVDVFGLNKG